MSNGLIARAVTKSWGERHVLDKLDLEVDAGEVVAVLGRSGCGKTTLLRIVAGLERPDAGSVSIGGDDVTTLRPAARRVGMVFQQHALLPHLSVAENIGFGLRTRRRSTRVDARIERVAAMVGCVELIERLPATLSGGERQRVALARALVNTPRLVLLDEPLSSLDAQDRAVLRTELRRALVASGATAVHVTHDQAEAFAVGDRVAVVGEGTVQQIGTADQLYDSPATSSVASLVGTPQMNLFEVDNADDLMAGPFPIQAVGERAGISLTAGIRPADVRIVGTDHPDSIPGVIVAVEIVDEAAVVHVETEPDGHVVRISVGRSTRPTVGERVGLHADPQRFHLFDCCTGAALHHPSRSTRR